LKSLGHSCRLIVTVEDHSIIGGLGSAIAEVLAEQSPNTRLMRLGIADQYGESGPAPALYDKFGISAERIAEKIRTALK
jgi:transketolase